MPDKPIVFEVTLGELAEVPGAPFAYWAPKSLRELFKKYPPLDRDVARMPDKPKIADVKQGLATADDLRFTRCWWEVPVDEIATSREETLQGKKWVPFAKGGKPFYHDIQLVVNWERNGEEIKNYRDTNGRLMSRPQNESYYFRAGLAWARIAEAGVESFFLPQGTIFDVNSGASFSSIQPNIFSLVALLNSKFTWFLGTIMEPIAHTMQIGTIARIPIAFETLEANRLSFLGCHAHDLLREWATGDETSTVFVAPWILQLYWRLNGKGDDELKPVTGHPLARDFAWRYSVPDEVMEWFADEMKNRFSLRTLAEGCVRWETWLRRRIDEIQHQIDDEVYRIYGISEEDRRLIESELAALAKERKHEAVEADEGEPEEAVRDDVLPAEEHIRRLVHYVAHEAIREDPDGIVPLSDCYPAGRAEMEPGLPRRVRGKLKAIFGEEAMPVLEREIREALGKPLDDWLADDFFGYHLGLYRLRPVIWQVVASRTRRTRRSVRRSPAPKDFSVFLYWHKLDSDTLRKVRSVYLEPHLQASLRALREAERRFRELQAGEAPIRALRDAERTLELARSTHEALEGLAGAIDTLLRPHSLEVQSRSEWVKEKVNEIVSQGYRPNRDYGVRVNIEPLKQAGVLHPASERVRG